MENLKLSSAFFSTKIFLNEQTPFVSHWYWLYCLEILNLRRAPARRTPTSEGAFVTAHSPLRRISKGTYAGSSWSSQGISHPRTVLAQSFLTPVGFLNPQPRLVRRRDRVPVWQGQTLTRPRVESTLHWVPDVFKMELLLAWMKNNSSFISEITFPFIRLKIGNPN